MGYACPVCETPQRDGEHLAHHLAFTAMLHGDEHEAWLDEHVPDWDDCDPAGLANAVTDHAEPAEYHEVFEDTTGRVPGRPDVDVDVDAPASDRGTGPGGHDHDHGAANPLRDPDPSELDPEAAAAVREARDLMREQYADETDEGAEAKETEGADGDTKAVRDAEAGETDKDAEMEDGDTAADDANDAGS